MVVVMKTKDQQARVRILAKYGVEASRCKEVHFRAGQALHMQDDPIEHIFLIISGTAFIYKSASNGLSGASCYECSHGCIGAMEIFYDAPRFDCSSTASTDVTAFLVPIEYAHELLNSSFTFVRQIANDLAEQLRRTHITLINVQTHSALERLALYLVDTSKMGCYSATIQQAATAIGVSYRHAWRLFQELQENGVLKKQGKVYQIASPRKLYALASQTG